MVKAVPQPLPGAVGREDLEIVGEDQHEHDGRQKDRRGHKKQREDGQQLVQPCVHLHGADDAHRHGDDDGQYAAEDHQAQGDADALGDEGAHLLAVLVALPQVAPEDAGHPDEILLHRALVQVEVGPQGLLGLLTDRLAAGHGGDGVRRRDAHHSEDEDRHHRKHQHHLDDPLQNKFSHQNTPFLRAVLAVAPPCCGNFALS